MEPVISTWIRVVVKNPDENIGHSETIPNELEDLQRLVGGHIEAVDIGLEGVIALVNEDGRNIGLPANCWVLRMGYIPEQIVGPIVIVGTDGPEFTDCSWGMDDMKMMLRIWGNEYGCGTKA